ncbi:hypothetical protein E0L93_03505 [Rubrobacter taiwanensis]|uniref:Uncharacterized protein n=1 Tax=Rubrobacter taiwanensis TaxID=185139 RepID=A0A4V2NX62_9ACTN|nr:hypothetical protein [Rubrobacter taiwanensis]TCJ20022.1 hypothetical protein E0L93_03505 [Rubrobacter taiwanensis]
MSFWTGYVGPALLFTIFVLALNRASGDPKVPRGDDVLADLCLGLAATVAAVLWLRVLAAVFFR